MRLPAGRAGGGALPRSGGQKGASQQAERPAPEPRAGAGGRRAGGRWTHGAEAAALATGVVVPGRGSSRRLFEPSHSDPEPARERRESISASSFPGTSHSIE
ncbi:hypothetical protein GUJ93_ZPchr0006g43872 [Zizania palustris]|uniref:Uncharacterized protein n=1 Tax=Zizania palustris TaxID=103762 RepID=A0A8J5SGD9_ZIZPA|nr:hypothetical protein GUJ93_ZPchr0006g43872 [Zizania palustris]